MSRHRPIIKTKFMGGPIDGTERKELKPDDNEIKEILFSDRVHRYQFSSRETLWTYLGVKECEGS